jgi:hypothetical protein
MCRPWMLWQVVSRRAGVKIPCSFGRRIAAILGESVSTKITRSASLFIGDDLSIFCIRRRVPSRARRLARVVKTNVYANRESLEV